ncbi:MAG: HPF/RaiA family ribosome-associated protein [Candidatus Acidiferrales bacterium]
MKSHISFHDVSERQALRTELARQNAKFDRQLKKFDPDLFDLHVSLVRRTRRGAQFIASVTLYLPMGQLHASEEASHSVVALKHACAQLMRELKRFKARLRGDDKRRQARRSRRRASL